ncbi:nephronectin-like [Archocentrus centrarchus]|uniref:nephronectin-like n=1 Tax=Archocentrus centrarchus TaxID=63155 RepID=UPI0011E9FC50|nr:nephronectin-like [Archocentrus centrarchus]
MLALFLLSCFCLWTRGQRLDHDSWADQAALSRGLCRHGNSVECCWGWKQLDWGRCEPHCQQGCKHGECVGPDQCKCHPGYTGKACNQDLNECGVKPRPCKHRCMNTLGSYKCYCLDGYALQPDGSCRNAQTCYHANCQYGCEVIKGAVRCTCPSPGLRLGPDRRTCVDIDECVLGGGVCPRRRKCVNTFGSFICKCHLGFRLMYINGQYTCIDKDTRPFCSLNPSSPKCRCKDGSCKAIPKVILEPHRPRTTTPTTSTTTAATTTSHPTTTITTTTTQPTTTIITTTFLSTSTDFMTTTPSPITDVITAPVTPAATTTMPTTTPATITTTTLPTTTEMDTATPTTPPPPPPTTPATTIPSTTTPVTSTTAPTTLPTTTELDTTTQTTPPPPPTTTAVAATTAVTTMLPSTSLQTTTVNNRINKDVTQKQRGDVHIPRHPSHNHVWEFDIELGNIAEDDAEVGELHCSFDHGLCDWMSDREGDLHWETVHNPAGGRYLSVPELKAGQRSVRGARLAIGVVPSWSHGDLCLSFSHWLTGHHVGVLQLFVRKRGRDQRYGPALWSRTGGHGWRHTEVTLMTHSLDRVLLKAERRTGRRGQIAIDDVTLRQGACR